MDAQAFLEQLLESGKKLAQQGLNKSSEIGSEIAEQGKDLTQQGIEYAEEKLNFPAAGPERDALLKNLGIGAAAGGILALLVGTKSGRKVLGPAVKLGSLAALGGLGYKVYSDWKKGQGSDSTGEPIGNLRGPAANERSLLLVRAMIAASKADGVVDADEQQLIGEKITSSELDGDASEILRSEIQKPTGISELAAAADSPEAAVEVYLASLLVADQSNEAERGYLEKLGQALKLDPQLLRQLEAETLTT